MTHLTFLGEAPSRTTCLDGLGAFEGTCGEKIARMIGLDFETFLQRCRHLNAWDHWPGCDDGGGSVFPRPEPETVFARLGLATGDATILVVVGRRLASSLGLVCPHFTWFLWRGVPTAVIPHPSQKNVSFNSPEFRREADAFGRTLRCWLDVEFPEQEWWA